MSVTQKIRQKISIQMSELKIKCDQLNLISIKLIVIKIEDKKERR